MTLAEIREMPTRLDCGSSGPRLHESVFRSFHCVSKIRELLDYGAPPAVIVEIIDDIMKAPGVTRTIEV